jgi:2-phosphoglycerate kinase
MIRTHCFGREEFTFLASQNEFKVARRGGKMRRTIRFLKYIKTYLTIQSGRHNESTNMTIAVILSPLPEETIKKSLTIFLVTVIYGYIVRPASYIIYLLVWKV